MNPPIKYSPQKEEKKQNEKEEKHFPVKPHPQGGTHTAYISANKGIS